MGNTFSQSNSSPQYPTHSAKKIQEILKLYTFICQSYDSSLGKLKIFRKRQYNFDYVAQVDKLVERDYVDQLMKIAKINDITKSQNSKFSSDPHYSKLKSLTILKDASLWLKIFGYEVLEEGNNQHFKRIKVCYQYFNFTLKDYLERIPSTQKKNAYNIPPWLAYILATILDGYNQLKLLKIQHPHLSIIPILSSITTPSFIYIDIQGCLKFLPIPFFIMTDYSSNVDQCLVRCCRFEGEGQRMNVVVPKYGERSMRKQDEGFDKTDKIFMTRFKKLIKYMIKQIQPGDNHIRDSNGGSDQTGINTPQNIPINLHHPNYNFNSFGSQKTGLTYWEVLQNTQSLAQMIRIISSVQEIQNCLQILKAKNHNISNQSMFLGNYPLSNHNTLNKQKKKLQKFGLQDRLATNNSQHLTTNSLNITKSSANMNHNKLSQLDLLKNPGVEKRITKTLSQYKYYQNNGKNNAMLYHL